MGKIFFGLLLSIALYGMEGVLIPFYHFPTYNDPKIQKLIAYKRAYPTIKFLVIINPANGDFARVESNFASAIKALEDANITVLGYVYSSYARRNLTSLKRRIDAWREYKRWGVHGIFIDEVSTDLRSLKYYKNVTEYIKKSFSIVVFNPGTFIDKRFERLADIIVVREHSKSIPNKSTIAKSAILLHAVDDFQRVKSDIATYQYVYVTEQDGANPWENISSYMPQLLEFIQQKKTQTSIIFKNF